MRFAASLLVLLAAFIALSHAQCYQEGFRARFFNDVTPFRTPVIAERYEIINFNLLASNPAVIAPKVGKERYSIVWDGEITPPTTGNYFFRFRSDDGFRFYLGRTLMFPNTYITRTVANSTTSTPVYLVAGSYYKVVIHYFNLKGDAAAMFLWRHTNWTDFQIIPASSVRTLTCGIDLNPDPLTISDSPGYTSFNVSLKSNPNATVTVNFTSPFSLNTCSVTFNQSTWDVPYTITVYNDPNLPGSACHQINATSGSSNPLYDAIYESLCLAKTAVFGSKSLSWGDPHIVTFDGFQHDFFETGDYFLVRQINGEFSIQTRQSVCAQASCNTAVAIKYRSVIFYVYLGAGGVPSTFTYGDIIANHITITGGGKEFAFITQNGIKVEVKVGFWEARSLFYLSVQTAVPASYLLQLVGLAGYYDGSPTNDCRWRSGIISCTNLLGFQRSWKCLDSEDLFLNPEASIPPLYGASAPSDAIPQIAECRGLPAAVSNTTADFSAKSSPLPEELKNKTEVPGFSPPTSPNFTDPETKEKANTTCSTHFTSGDLVLVCRSCGVDPAKYYKQCMTDYAIAGDESFVPDALNAFIAECASRCAAKNTTLPTNSTCANMCSLRGSCNAGTCACDEGFSGPDCSRKEDDPPNVVSASPPSGSGNCSSTVTIAGKGFFGNLVCLFGTVSSPATILSEWALTCPIPPQANGVVRLRISRNGLEGTAVNFTYYEACCTSPCRNGATCSDLSNGTFTCACQPGYLGQRCDQLPPNCDSLPCKNGATCTPTPSGFNCSCTSQFQGPTCDTVIPEKCANITMKNYCYDASTDSTLICYSLSFFSHPTCNRTAFNIGSSCTSVSSSGPTGSFISSPQRFSWNVASSPSGDYCMSFDKYVAMTPSTYQLLNGATVIKQGPVETPDCSVPL